MELGSPVIPTGGEAGGRLAPGFSPPSFYGNDERRERNLPHSSTPVSRMKFNRLFRVSPVVSSSTWSTIKVLSFKTFPTTVIAPGNISVCVQMPSDRLLMPAERDSDNSINSGRLATPCVRLRRAQSAPISSVSLRVPVTAFTYP